MEESFLVTGSGILIAACWSVKCDLEPRASAGRERDPAAASVRRQVSRIRREVAPKAFERHGEEGLGIAPLWVDALRRVGRYRFGGAQALGQALDEALVDREIGGALCLEVGAG